VLAFVLVIGTISIVDLRLLGIASLNRAVKQLFYDVLPYTWIAFGAAALSGSLLFLSSAMTYAHNSFFRGKLVLLAVAGLNMAVFHLVGIGDVELWGTTRQTPPAAKIAGALSLAVWTSVVVFGRSIGFTLH
jgi:hypothetical protein